jgi:hypothetical protein
MKEHEIRHVLESVCKELDARNAARKARVPAALMGASLALVAVGCSSSDSTTTPPVTDNDAGTDAQPDQTTAPDADAGPTIEYGGPPNWDADAGPVVDYMAPDAGDQDVDAGPQPEYMAADAGDQDVDSGAQMDYGAPQDK